MLSCLGDEEDEDSYDLRGQLQIILSRYFKNHTRFE